jgi:hypothetical protein
VPAHARMPYAARPAMSRREFVIGTAAAATLAISNAFAGAGLRIFAIRGLTGVLFSNGMTVLTAELNKLPGVTCSVEDHGLVYCENVKCIAREAVAAAHEGNKIVLIGHSLGGDCAVRTAMELGESNVRVALLIAVDASWFSCPPVPGNVSTAICYYQNYRSLDFRGHHILQRGPEFAGRLIRERLDEGHDTIDKSPAVHRKIVASVRRIAGARPA